MNLIIFFFSTLEKFVEKFVLLNTRAKRIYDVCKWLSKSGNSPISW